MRIRKIRTTIALVIFLCGFASLAQDDPYAKRFVPPGPTASSLGQYGEVPVSLYTGVANIKIPMYTVQERSLSVPIGLSYHASGIKVDQMPSWVGMGWALNAGGTVTRTIMGLPDEATHGYAAHADRIIDFMNGVPDTGMTYSDEDVAWWTATGIWDSEPDVYYYNLGGASGKMVFDKNGTPRMIPHAKLSVTGNVTTGFTIKSPDGTTYVFDSIEHTDTESTGNDPNLVSGNTAFNLTSITSTTGETITFTYESESQSYTVGSSQSKQHNMPGFLDLDCQVNGATSLSENILVAGVKRLSEINSNHIKVKFIEKTTVNGFGMKYLDKIEVYDQADLTTPIRQFDLTIGNFGSGDERGKLESVVQKDGAGNALSPYTFDYNDITFPDRLSPKQDHWGYYNGNTSADLIPAATQLTYTVSGSPHTINYSGADRSADAAKSKALILTKITYPTGGHTSFDYEQHTYSSIGSSRIYENLNYDVSESRSIEATAFNSVTSSTFVITGTQQVTVDINVTGLSGITGEVGGRVEIQNSSGGTIHTQDIPADNTTYGIVKTWTLAPGTYKLYAISDFGEVITTGCAYLTPVSITEPTAPTIGLEDAGGVRIQKITIHDGLNSANDIIKTYDYHNGGTSNGVLLFQPMYELFSTNVIRKQLDDGAGGLGGGIPVYIYKDCPLFVRSSSNRSALGATQGSHIGYSKVTEYLGEGTITNGKTEYEFTTSLDHPDSPSGIVAAPAALTSYDYKRGLLKNRTDYKYNSPGSYSEVKETVNNYTFRTDVNMTSIPAFKIAVRRRFDYDRDRNEYDISSYNQVSQWFYSDSQTETVYNQGGSGSMSTTTNYTYNSTHLQPTSIVTTNSKGQTETVDMKYAADLSNGLLTSAFMHSIPLETSRKLDGVVISKNVATYSLDLLHIVPTEFKIYPSGGTDYLKVNYSYDAFGNVNEVTKADELPKALFWSHDGEYPILEAQNISALDLITVVNWAFANMTKPSGVTTFPAFLDYLDDMTTTGQKQAWTDFNLKLNEHSLMKYAMASSYTYLPGIGMTSQTSPNGLVSYFEYDSYGRLTYVRDQDGNILKVNTYAYQVNANAVQN